MSGVSVFSFFEPKTRNEPLRQASRTSRNRFTNTVSSSYSLKVGKQESGKLVNYYNKLQLYKILDKCNKLSDPKIHLIANRLHQIQLDETTAYQKIYTKYLRILTYVPFVTFVAFIILAYEFIRRYIVNHFRAKNTV